MSKGAKFVNKSPNVSATVTVQMQNYRSVRESQEETSYILLLCIYSRTQNQTEMRWLLRADANASVLARFSLDIWDIYRV